jgi:dihydroorotate dehydrogenase (fumarate)
MANLTTSYMGLKLRNPIIVSSSDLTKTSLGIVKCEQEGAGAVVLKSVFEEQFQVGESDLGKGIGVHPEALNYLRSGGLLKYAPQKICQTIEEVKKEVKIPVIASVNCQSPQLWPNFAHQFQEAGADGLELNIYFLPLDLDTPGSVYEENHFQILKEVKKKVSIPVAVKLASQMTSFPFLGKRLADSGCDALVLFNWFLQPDVDTESLKTRNIIGKGDFHQSLRWVALLAGRVNCDIASSGGVSRAEDIVKQILAGASAVQVCSLFYRKGLGVLSDLVKGLETWMDGHGYSSIDDFRGELSFKHQEISFKGLGKADAYFRAQYLKTFTRKES